MVAPWPVAAFGGAYGAVFFTSLSTELLCLFTALHLFYAFLTSISQ